MPTDAFPADSLTVPWGRIALVLVLTLLATLGAVAAARGAGRSPRGRQRLLGLLDTLPLGPNRAIYVVEAAGRQLLLAVTNDQVTSLGELQPVPSVSPATGVATPVATGVATPVGARPEPAREPEPLRLLPPAPGALGPSPFDRVLEGIRSFDARAGRRERTA